MNFRAKYYKNGIWYLAGSAAQGATPLILTPVLTRALSPNQFGSFVTIIAIGTILSFLFALGLPAALIREITLEVTDLKTVVSSLSLYKIVIQIFSVFFFMLSFFFKDFIYTILIALSLGLSLSLILIQLTIFKSIFKARLFAITALLSTAAPSLFLIIISYFFVTSYIINFYVIFVMVFSILILIKYNKISNFKIAKTFKKLLKIGFPTIPHDLGMSIFQYGDKIIIASLFGLSIAGQIHVAVLIGGLPYLLLSSLSNIWAPAVLENFRDDQNQGLKFLNRTTLYMVIAASFISLFLIFTSTTWLSIFAPSEYFSEELPSLIGLMSISGAIYAVYLRNMHLLTLAGNFKSLIWISPLTIITQITLIFFASPIYGLKIVAVAHVLAVVMQALLTQLVSRRIFPTFNLTQSPFLIFGGLILIYFLTD